MLHIYIYIFSIYVYISSMYIYIYMYIHTYIEDIIKNGCDLFILGIVSYSFIVICKLCL